MPPRCRWCKQKLSRGQYVNIFKRRCFMYAECRSRLTCMTRILKQRDALLGIGRQMYNVFFNISQRSEYIHPRDPIVFADMKVKWEAAKEATGL